MRQDAAQPAPSDAPNARRIAATALLGAGAALALLGTSHPRDDLLPSARAPTPSTAAARAPGLPLAPPSADPDGAAEEPPTDTGALPIDPDALVAVRQLAIAWRDGVRVSFDDIDEHIRAGQAMAPLPLHLRGLALDLTEEAFERWDPGFPRALGLDEIVFVEGMHLGDDAFIAHPLGLARRDGVVLVKLNDDSDLTQVLGTLQHELAHVALASGHVGDWEAVAATGTGARADHVSGHAMTNPGEDFAETVELWVERPDQAAAWAASPDGRGARLRFVRDWLAAYGDDPLP
jgi:hypothetical protein